MTTHLIWFRSDLRLHDNLALTAACSQKKAQVLALFIATPDQWLQHMMAPRQASYILTHLNSLQNELSKIGIPLIYSQVSDFDAQIKKLCEICIKYRVTHLFYNYQYEFNEQKRDKQLEKRLSKVICQGFDDSVILASSAIRNNNQDAYKTFTPFKKAWLKRLKERLPKCMPAPLARGPELKIRESITFDYPQQTFDTNLFPINEQTAINKLRNFCRYNTEKYEEKRDFPSIEGTSRLSPCLTLGIISPRQCLHYFLARHPNSLDKVPRGSWLNELIWREFYNYLLICYPNLCKHIPFINWTCNIQWNKNDINMTAWEQGKTGYPIVDAAMRQLNITGWMHNRLRMITASFLTKDLLIDWRRGEHYFISHLIDGNLAANNGGWQWVASTGADAAPYFRIFNPIIQSRKFDSEGVFIRRWLPELAQVPGKAIHNPWEWADKMNIILNYPRQIVDHKQAYVTTLIAYKNARKIHKDSHCREL